MKASKYIEELQKLIDKHGDLEMYYLDKRSDTLHCVYDAPSFHIEPCADRFLGGDGPEEIFIL